MAQSKRWCLTLNNYTPEEGLAMVEWPCSYGIIAKEVGTSGTPHLQCYFIFNTNQRLRGVKKFNPRGHWEVARGTTEDSVRYCSKASTAPEDIMEIGQRPKTREVTKADQKAKWLDVVRSMEEGTCKEEYPHEFLQYNSTALRLYAPEVESINEYTGHWWVGNPGTGKSRKAREDHPDLYDKLLNKWWDGYVDEETVLIDDIGPDQKMMGTFLKRYADHYPFRAEYKGGSKVIRPKTIIVTSNYSIEEIWAGDQQMIDAINRRYKTTKFLMINMRHE